MIPHDPEKQVLELLAKPKRILLVEDEDVIRELTRRLCAGYNVEILEATNRADALESLARETFDIILLDIKLGPESGADLFRELRGRGDDTPVVFISGYLDYDTVEAINRIDFVCFMLKPHQYNHRFAAAVMGVLGIKKLPDHLPPATSTPPNETPTL